MGWTIEEWLELWDTVIPLMLDYAETVICYQTDRRHNGTWLSKPNLILKHIEGRPHELRWHRIVLRRPVGSVDLYRPTYSHLIALSTAPPGERLPDVIQGGRPVYENGLPMLAASQAITWAVAHGHDCIVDPFCGRGTIPVMAEHLGVESIGVDIDPDQCAAARTLEIHQGLPFFGEEVW